VALQGDEGARRLVARYAAQPIAVDDPGVRLDLDTHPPACAALTSRPGPEPGSAQAVLRGEVRLAFQLGVAYAVLAQAFHRLQQVVQRRAVAAARMAQHMQQLASGRRPVQLGLRRGSVKASARSGRRACGSAASAGRRRR
jgi:hypothetical protein